MRAKSPIPFCLALAVAACGRPSPSETVTPAAVPAIHVTVAGEVWQPVRRLEDSGPDDPHYYVSVDDDGSASVVFGDGIRGRRPPAGSTVRVAYRDGSPEAGGMAVSVERVMPSIAQLRDCLSIRVQDRRFVFEPCDND